MTVEYRDDSKFSNELHSVYQIADALRHKKFGKDVREAIAQAVEKLYGIGPNTVISGSPAGAYATLSELQNAYPNGQQGVFVVAETGKWYLWNPRKEVWMEGGDFQAPMSQSEVEDGRIWGDGTKSNSIGTAIRGQVAQEKAERQKGDEKIASLIYDSLGLVRVTTHIADGDGGILLDNDDCTLSGWQLINAVDDSFKSEILPASAKATKDAIEKVEEKLNIIPSWTLDNDGHGLFDNDFNILSDYEETVEYSFDYKKYQNIYQWNKTGVSGGKKQADMHIPIVAINGPIPETKSDGKYKVMVSIDGKHSGKGSIGIQGNSSTMFPKKNYTINFAEKFCAYEGWPLLKKYVLKGNYNDFTYARNIVSARLWGQVVKSRNFDTTIILDNDGSKAEDNNGDSFTNFLLPLPGTVQGGAIDGHICMLIVNGRYHGLYDLQIPKGPEMFGIDENDDKQAVLSCERNDGKLDDYARVQFKKLTNIDGNDFDYEHVTKGKEYAVKASFNTMIQHVIDSTGAEYESTLGDYLDMDSIIDYMIFTTLINATDDITRNYLMTTYDGKKWFMSAYDLDCTFGNYQDGGLTVGATQWPTLKSWQDTNRAMHLAYTYDKERVKRRYEELRQNVLSDANIYDTVITFCKTIPRELKKHELSLWPETPSSDVMTAEQMITYYMIRSKIVDIEVNNLI